MCSSGRPASLLAANKFVKANWAESIDLKTGRPVWSAETKAIFEKGAGHKVRIWPALVGGKNWAPMSYSPQTRLAYVNSTDFGWDYEALPLEELAKLKPGQSALFRREAANMSSTIRTDAAICGRSIRSPASRNGRCRSRARTWPAR